MHGDIGFGKAEVIIVSSRKLSFVSMKNPCLNEFRHPPGILGAINGRNRRGHVWKDTTEVMPSTEIPLFLGGRIHQCNVIIAPRGVPTAGLSVVKDGRVDFEALTD